MLRARNKSERLKRLAVRVSSKRPRGRGAVILDQFVSALALQILARLRAKAAKPSPPSPRASSGSTPGSGTPEAA